MDDLFAQIELFSFEAKLNIEKQAHCQELFTFVRYRAFRQSSDIPIWIDTTPQS